MKQIWTPEKVNIFNASVDEMIIKLPPNQAIAFTDGAYSQNKNKAGYGVIIICLTFLSRKCIFTHSYGILSKLYNTFKYIIHRTKVKYITLIHKHFTQTLLHSQQLSAQLQ